MFPAKKRSRFCAPPIYLFVVAGAQHLNVKNRCLKEKTGRTEKKEKEEKGEECPFYSAFGEEQWRGRAFWPLSNAASASTMSAIIQIDPTAPDRTASFDSAVCRPRLEWPRPRSQHPRWIRMGGSQGSVAQQKGT